MTTGIKPTIVLVDLDGTLVPINTFHHWIAHIVVRGLSGLPLRKRITTRIAILALCLRRVLGVISHDSFKRGIQLAWMAATRDVGAGWEQEEIGRFVYRIRSYIDPRVWSLIMGFRSQGAITLLTTAAPAEYAECLGRELGFTTSVPTPRALDSTWSNNAKHAKLSRSRLVLERLSATGPMAVLTDHIDDLPLMQAADIVFLVGSIGQRRDELAIVLGADKVIFCLG
jgi:phosphoserine phosphatase